MNPTPPTPRQPVRVLAIAPRSRSFGFAVLEYPALLVDWGTRSTKSEKTTRTLAGAAGLIGLYEPSVLVLEDADAPGTRRAPRIRELLRRLQGLAEDRGLGVRLVSRGSVREAFQDVQARSKHEIATAIVRRFPEVEDRLPPRREAWMSEDERMAIFDAIAFGLAHLAPLPPGALPLETPDDLRAA